MEKKYDLKILSAIAVIFLMLSAFAIVPLALVPAFGAGTATQTSADASKKLGTSTIGMEIMDDSITLNGILPDDTLEPFENDYSGFPWSKEDVSVTITKYGEIPQFEVGYEHIYSGFPVSGWILEVDFNRGGAQTGNFTRYWWAQYSRVGSDKGNWQSTDLDAFNATIVPDSFKLLVNTTRLAIVKVDLVLLMNDSRGIVRGPITGNVGGYDCQEGLKFFLNYTYVFFKDKKYVVEHKNIFTEVDKWIAVDMDVQFMQDIQFDVDYGYSGKYKCDADFYSVAPKNASDDWDYTLGMQYWPGNYSLAVVEPDETVIRGTWQDHTGYVAFYPNCSNWDVNFFTEADDPMDIDPVDWQPASNNYRYSAGYDQSDLIMGAWNFTLLGDGAVEDYKLTSVIGAAEEQWDTGDDGIPDSDGALYEIAWALNETFSPHYKLNYIDTYDWWPFIGDGWTEKYYGSMGGSPDSNWPWWDGQKEGWEDDMANETLAMFIVGDTMVDPENPVKLYGALTHDNLAAIDVAQAVGNILGVDAGDLERPYRSALDSQVAEYDEGDGLLSLHRWYHSGSYQYPTRVCSHVDWCQDLTTDPYIDEELPWKTNVWHILTFGGPAVNTVTNYFNDFSHAVGVGAWPTAEDMLPVLPSDNKGGAYAFYVPGSKSVYYDYKVGSTCHYFARVSLVMDMNITREGPNESPEGDCYPWAAMIIDGIRAEGTVAAGSFVAHTWQYWKGWDLFDTMNDGAVALILEFIDDTQDGHIDEVRVVEVVGTVVTSLTEVPDIDWEVPAPE